MGGNRGGGKLKKSSTDSESGDETASLERYFCLEPHRASDCPNRYASATAPATPNSQQGGYLCSVRTNIGVRLLAVTSARTALAARGAPRERHGDVYWVADSGATTNMAQASSPLKDYTPTLPGNEVESAGRVFLPVAGYGRLRLLVDEDNGTFKRAMHELTLDRVAHVPKLGRHNLLSIKRLTTAFDAPMRVYPAAATFRPRFGRKTLVFRSLRPETGFLEIKGSPSRRYEGAANAANDSAIDGDSQGKQNPSKIWRHAGPSESRSTSTLTTGDEPSASATSPPAKSSCVRLPYGTPQPTPERQFPVIRRLKGGGGRRRIIRRDPRKAPTTRPHWRGGRQSRRSRNRNRTSRRGRVGRKVRLS